MTDKNKADKAVDLKAMPAESFLFSASNCDIGLFASADTDGQEREVRMFKMIANSGQPFSHPSLGTVGIDMAGVSTKSERMPALRDHKSDKIVGVTTEFKAAAKDGIVVSGEIFDDEPAGAEVARLSDKGFPWEASVYIPPTKVERVPQGSFAMVNGHKLKGPGFIFRESVCKEVTFTAVGQDPNTSVACFQHAGETINLEALETSFNKENHMEFTLETLTAAQLKEHRSDLVDELTAEATEASTAALAEAEKTASEKFAADKETEAGRVTAIFAAAREYGSELDDVQAAIEKGEDEATAKLRFADARIKALNAAAPQSPGPNVETEQHSDTGIDPELQGEEKYKAEFDADVKVRNEFAGSFEEYCAFRRNEDKGLIKILNNNKK